MNECQASASKRCTTTGAGSWQDAARSGRGRQPPKPTGAPTTQRSAHRPGRAGWLLRARAVASRTTPSQSTREHGQAMQLADIPCCLPKVSILGHGRLQPRLMDEVDAWSQHVGQCRLSSCPALLRPRADRRNSVSAKRWISGKSASVILPISAHE